jgi:exopolyphosphatase / guanosine-5'-triphosphate,3'-diphosphate pyrophosphatase
MPVTKNEIYAAIDLGTNALRAVIALKNGAQIRVVKNYRQPLRLGVDVFDNGKISAEKFVQTTQCFSELKNIFKLYKVTRVKAVATSAIRNASNGDELLNHIKKTTGIEVEKINGITEAMLIQKAASSQYDLAHHLTLYIDIGGGSVEYSVSLGDFLLGSKSFPIGTLRLLSCQNVEKMIETIQFTMIDVQSFVLPLTHGRPIEVCIGTGGNLRRMGKLRKQLLKKESSNFCTDVELEKILKKVAGMTLDQRIKTLDLKKDRADVIVPAMMVVLQSLKTFQIENLNLPKVGLKEGILLSMNPDGHYQLEGFSEEQEH